MAQEHASELTKIAVLMSAARRRLLDDGLHEAAKLVLGAARQLRKAQQVLDPRNSSREAWDSDGDIYQEAPSLSVDIDFDAIPQPIRKAKRAARRAHKFSSTKVPLDQVTPALDFENRDELQFGDVLARWRTAIRGTLLGMSGDAGLVDRVIERTVTHAKSLHRNYIYRSALIEEDLFKWLTRVAGHSMRAQERESQTPVAQQTSPSPPDPTQEKLLAANQRLRQDAQDIREGVAN